MAKRDYYKALGVPKGAAEEDIKKAKEVLERAEKQKQNSAKSQEIKTGLFTEDFKKSLWASQR